MGRPWFGSRVSLRGLMLLVAAVALFLGGYELGRRREAARHQNTTATTFVVTTAIEPSGLPSGPAAKDPVRPTYRGTTIRAGDLPNVPQALQVEIARRFERRDPCPPQRLEHFRWLELHGVSIVGWYGHLEGVTRDGQGWRAKFRVRPDLHREGEIYISTSDSYIETYHYDRRRLSFESGAVPSDAIPGLFTD